jgi:hypothetical protein
MKNAKIFTLFLLLTVLCGCNPERRGVKTYLDQVATELPAIRTIGESTEDAFDELRFGPRTKDLDVLAQRVADTRTQLSGQVEQLKQSRERVARVTAPQPADHLHNSLLESYDDWIACGEKLVTICHQAEATLNQIQDDRGPGKWQRLGEAGRQLGDDLRALGRQARDAERSTKAMGREYEKLQKRFHVAVRVPDET